jgi:hypothetical protein
MEIEEERLQKEIRNRLWKSIGLASDVVAKINDMDDVPETRLKDTLRGHGFDDSDVDDVFKEEIYSCISSMESFQENGTLSKQEARELNESFRMLSDVAEHLNITVQ